MERNANARKFARELDLEDFNRDAFWEKAEEYARLEGSTVVTETAARRAAWKLGLKIPSRMV